MTSMKPTTQDKTATTQDKAATMQNLDRLLTGFAGNRIVFWVLVAIAVHVAIILGTSLTFVHDRWIDPEGAEQRAAAVVAEQKRANRVEAAANAPTMAGLTNAAAVVRDVDGSRSTSRDPSVIPADRADTPVAKRITEVAKPEEMPALGGGDLGISIEDTSLR